MLLLEFLKSRGLRLAEFAESIGEPESTIRKIAYRQRQPSLGLSVKITAATDDHVTAADLLLPAATEGLSSEVSA